MTISESINSIKLTGRGNKMIYTEKAHWVNGHQVRGGWFHTLNLSLGSYGIMLSWAYPKNKGVTKLPHINFYRLKERENKMTKTEKVEQAWQARQTWKQAWQAREQANKKEGK